MGRMNRDEQNRRDGFEYFASIYMSQDIRIPEIDAEIASRKLTGKPIGLLKSAEAEYRKSIQVNCIQLCVINSAWVLHDKFGYGEKRIRKFVDAFMKMMGEYIAGDYVSWDDIRQALLKEVGIYFEFEE
jgi:hypothetical protein